MRLTAIGWVLFSVAVILALVLALAGCRGWAPNTETSPSAPAPASTVLQTTCNVEAGSVNAKPTYTFTLDNVTSGLINVGGVTVVFNDASGNEQGSNSPFVTGTITAGQSLSWTVPVPDQFWTAAEDLNTGAEDYTTVPAGLTCTVVQWQSQ